MKILIAAAALLLPTLAAAESCNVEKPEELVLDLEGISTLVVEMGADTLNISGADGADGVVRGRACASSDKRLELLSLKQERDGDRLTLSLVREHRIITVSFGSDYAYHNVSVKVPASLALELNMGSGDANIQQVASLKADVGSGDLDARGIAGTLHLDLGSGDVVAHNIGALQIDSVGSGDAIVEGVAADTQIGTVGSGDVTVRDAKGSVRIESLGSGDITLLRIAGSVQLERMGSGDLRVTDIDGDVVVNRSGSGEVRAKRVKGAVRTPGD
ncbi:MAG: hypothetical protein CVV05_19865 [Gammaproteobacteria bacterium HGW-Gammaproteobacteria-1]|jgi:DUF4097 and DUF4098 domain-containing protein YvlB|nr:MAG: hypothetical protein CVV12_02290 [Gammaproteobacteria bacterium HGW-Gammaproteobacteria-2]PKM41967.1 MAG: hypothetical protein CVV05_19865 [Gammaproteobacteria bacterium HGW-Gammaproteobacteria-1]